jgi:hypothetical protein
MFGCCQSDGDWPFYMLDEASERKDGCRNLKSSGYMIKSRDVTRIHNIEAK